MSTYSKPCGPSVAWDFRTPLLGREYYTLRKLWRIHSDDSPKAHWTKSTTSVVLHLQRRLADDHWEYMNYANSLKWPANPAKTYVLLYWPIFEVHWLSENRWINPVVPATARLHASLEYIDTHVSRYSRFARAYELDIASSQEIVILPTSKREIKLRLKGRWRMPHGPPAGLCNRTLLRKRAIRL